MKYTDDSFGVGRGFANISTDPRGWIYGTMTTPNGIVTIYSQSGDLTLTRFGFAINGYLHSRSYHQQFSDIGLARLANKFAREIYEREVTL